MKQGYLLILLFISLLLMAAVSPGVVVGHAKVDDDYVFVPEGMMGDTMHMAEFYISSIEVTNAQYRQFINDLISRNDTEKLRLAMADTMVWQNAVHYNEPYTHYYFQHSAYDLYPVVNVSRRGAELYCEWLTQRYNEQSKQKAHFALPSEAQWMYAATGGNPKAMYPWPGKSVQSQKKGKYYHLNMCNYRVDSTRADAKQNDKVDITAPSRSYQPNTYGIYNMSGNVAEMLADRPYTKGGSWNSRADKMLISAREDADLSRGAATIGFRPVMIRE